MLNLPNLKIKIVVLVTVFTVAFLMNAVPVSAAASGSAVTPTGEEWAPDKEVTFVGKMAARSRDVLNWITENYEWSKVTSSPNPFNTIWLKLSTLAYALLALFILVAAFLLIITKGESITVRRFIPRFILVLILIYLSFAIVQLIYQLGDIIQGFFLHKPNNGDIIKASDLLNISWSYEEFIGFRRFSLDGQFDEAAMISLLLTKLTAATYYAMFAVLIIRKVILWFFLVVSPIFPLLLFFSPIRNTAKIWIGEFFRWVLYGPLFAIFLAGLVALWSDPNLKIGIPLALPDIPCSDLSKNRIVYPTATNILLGGPCQVLAPETGAITDVDQLNNLNNEQTFIQYLVALMMLWMVIIMPFLLLKIFLDYLNNLQFQDNNLLKYVLNATRKPTVGGTPTPVKPPPTPIQPFKPIIPPSTPVPSVGVRTAGMAREIPNVQSTGIAKEIARMSGLARSIPSFKGDYQLQDTIAQALKRSNMSIPTLMDIARFDAALSSRSALGRNEAHRFSEGIKRIAGTSPLMSEIERQQASKTRETLVKLAQEGNPVADSMIEATKSSQSAAISEINRVQQVNVEDYEEIKKTWQENYKNLEPPEDENGKPRTRKEWLKDETTKIPEAINLLNSTDLQMQKQGKEMVSKILPFLLLGGFSKQEVTAYLKAKLSAAKFQLSEESKNEEFVEIETKRREEPKTMTAEAEIPGEQKPKSEAPETEENHLGEEAVKLFPNNEEQNPVETVKVDEPNSNP